VLMTPYVFAVVALALGGRRGLVRLRRRRGLGVRIEEANADTASVTALPEA
jgi:hypothetical protein